MSSIEDIKEQFNKSLQKNEPSTDTKSIKKYFLTGLVVVISCILLNYHFSNKNYKTDYIPSDINDDVKNQKEEDQDPLFQKF